MTFGEEGQRIFAPYVHRMKLVGFVTLLGVLFGVLHFFLAPKEYRSGALILPNVENSSLQQIGDIASLVGVNLGAAKDPTLLYPDYLKSENILRSVLQDSTHGGSTIHQRLNGDAENSPSEEDIADFRDRLMVHRDQRSGATRLIVQMPDPNLAADVANLVVSHLDQHVRARRSGDALAQGEFLEDQLAKAGGALQVAREELVSFREQNRTIEASPALLQHESILNHEVLFHESIVLELRKQRELSRLYEERDISAVATLDVGIVPERPSRPDLKASTLGGAVLGFVAAVAWIFAISSLLPLVYGRRDDDDLI